jgi:putative serine protease PepD
VVRLTLEAMSRPKLLAYGVVVLLGGGGGVVLAGELANHNAAPAAKVAASTTATLPGSGSTSSAQKVYAGAKESVVAITAQTAQGTATGTGFVISQSGQIVTNDHVVQGARRVSVTIGTKGQPQTATVVRSDAAHDLALLKVNATGLKALKLADSGKVAVGVPVYAIGNPYGLDLTLTSGIVSAVNRDIQGLDGSKISGVLQTDAALNPGNSGGPLLDAAGEVVGVNSQIASGSQGGGNVGVGFAIGADTVKSALALA